MPSGPPGSPCRWESAKSESPPGCCGSANTHGRSGPSRPSCSDSDLTLSGLCLLLIFSNRTKKHHSRSNIIPSCGSHASCGASRSNDLDEATRNTRTTAIAILYNSCCVCAPPCFLRCVRVARPGRNHKKTQKHSLVVVVAVAPMLLVVRPGRAIQKEPQETQEPQP